MRNPRFICYTANMYIQNSCEIALIELKNCARGNLQAGHQSVSTAVMYSHVHLTSASTRAPISRYNYMAERLI